MLRFGRVTPVGIDEIDPSAVSPTLPRPSRICPFEIFYHPPPPPAKRRFPEIYLVRPNMASRTSSPRRYLPHIPHLGNIRHPQTHPSLPSCRSPCPPSSRPRSYGHAPIGFYDHPSLSRRSLRPLTRLDGKEHALPLSEQYEPYNLQIHRGLCSSLSSRRPGSGDHIVPLRALHLDSAVTR